MVVEHFDSPSFGQLIIWTVDVYYHRCFKNGFFCCWFNRTQCFWASATIYITGYQIRICLYVNVSFNTFLQDCNCGPRNTISFFVGLHQDKTPGQKKSFLFGFGKIHKNFFRPSISGKNVWFFLFFFYSNFEMSVP